MSGRSDGGRSTTDVSGARFPGQSIRRDRARDPGACAASRVADRVDRLSVGGRQAGMRGGRAGFRQRAAGGIQAQKVRQGAVRQSPERTVAARRRTSAAHRPDPAAPRRRRRHRDAAALRQPRRAGGSRMPGCIRSRRRRTAVGRRSPDSDRTRVLDWGRDGDTNGAPELRVRSGRSAEHVPGTTFLGGRRTYGGVAGSRPSRQRRKRADRLSRHVRGWPRSRDCRVA